MLRRARSQTSSLDYAPAVIRDSMTLPSKTEATQERMLKTLYVNTILQFLTMLAFVALVAFGIVGLVYFVSYKSQLNSIITNTESFAGRAARFAEEFDTMQDTMDLNARAPSSLKPLEMAMRLMLQAESLARAGQVLADQAGPLMDNAQPLIADAVPLVREIKLEVAQMRRALALLAAVDRMENGEPEPSPPTTDADSRSRGRH